MEVDGVVLSLSVVFPLTLLSLIRFCSFSETSVDSSSFSRKPRRLKFLSIMWTKSLRSLADNFGSWISLSGRDCFPTTGCCRAE